MRYKAHARISILSSNLNSPTMNKAYEIVDRERGMKCEVCGDRRAEHSHNFPRGKFPKFAEEPENITILCRQHHMDWEASRLWTLSSGVLMRAIKFMAAQKDTDQFDGVWSHLTNKLYKAFFLAEKEGAEIPVFLQIAFDTWGIQGE